MLVLRVVVEPEVTLRVTYVFIRFSAESHLFEYLRCVRPVAVYKVLYVTERVAPFAAHCKSEVDRLYSVMMFQFALALAVSHYTV